MLRHDYRSIVVIGPEGSGTTTTFVNLVALTGYNRGRLYLPINNNIVIHFSVPNGRPNDIHQPNSRAWLTRKAINDVDYIISVTRNKLDTVYSAYKRFYQTEPTKFMPVPHKSMVGINAAIENYNKAIQNIKTATLGKNVLEVRYEDLCNDYLSYYDKICRHIGVEFVSDLVTCEPAVSGKYLVDETALKAFVRVGWYTIL